MEPKTAVSKKVRNIEASGVRKMFEMASKIDNPINLSIGEPDFAMPENVRQKAIEAIQNGLTKYTPTTGIKELKEGILKKLERENGIKAGMESIIVTSAASGALSAIFTTLLERGDEIIIPDPYFVLYKQLAIQNEAIPVFVGTKDDFSLDIGAIEKAVTGKTKAIIINSPNNPTGKVYSEEELRKLAEAAKKHDLIVISDEIYEKFCFGKKHFSIGSIYENTITVNGFSKSHAMTGCRVGYCAGPKEIIQEAIKVQQFNFVCAPTAFQHACVEALGTGVENHIEEYKERRDLVYEGLKGKYKLTKPEGAFYAFIKYPFNGEEFIKKCVENRLLVVPGKTFSEHDTHFRISFAESRETIRKGIEILNRIA